MIKSLKPSEKASELIKKLIISYVRKESYAFALWKSYTKNIKTDKLLENKKINRVKEIMRLITEANLKAAHQKIIGHGNRVKGSLTCLIEKLRNRPKIALNQWKNFSLNVKSKTHFSGFVSAHLKSVFVRILSRRLLDTKNRIFGGGDKVKGVLKSITTVLKKKSKVTFTKWTKYIQRVKTKEILDNKNSAQLRWSLNQLLQRNLKDASARILGNGNKIKGIVKNVVLHIKKRPRNALKKWLKFADDCDKKVLLSGIVSQKLKNSLDRVTRRTLKDATQRIIGTGTKVNGALRGLFLVKAKQSKRSFYI